MKPTAYITKDRRMLIFADSPNMLPSDTSNLIPLFELEAMSEIVVRADENKGCGVEVVEGSGDYGPCGTKYYECDDCRDARLKELTASKLAKDANKEPVITTLTANGHVFSINEKLVYTRFDNGSIIGVVLKFVEDKYRKGAWIRDLDSGDILFAPASKMFECKTTLLKKAKND